ncbi:MAG TPA: hypothetical protein VLT88_03080, partial [Desulfosarcina sp.]|nr:hypothetical protein [Desulfosarcina sp.]
EEPPAHVLFFFATTEAHKIPVTILSRCQRHDLKRIDLDAVAAHLQILCRQDWLNVSAGNLRAIARESGGSMRDALSLLDQILACADSGMDDDDVTRMLGGMDRQLLFDLSAAIFSRDINRALAVVAAVYKGGQDLKRFYAELLMHFRHLMLIKMEAGPEMLDALSVGERELLAGQVADVSTLFIDQVFSLLFDAEPGVRRAAQPRLAIEMALFRIQQVAPALPIDTLIERLDALLRQAPAISGPGVVESQATYGPPASEAPDRDSAAAAAAVPPSRERVGDRLPGGVARDGRMEAPDRDHDAWRRVIAVIAKGKPSIAAALSRSTLVDVSEAAFTVCVRDNDYSVNLLKKHLRMIESACRDHGGRKIRIDFSGEDAGEGDAAAAKRRADDLRQKLLNHPLVADAVDLFNGKIEEINIK